MAAAVIIIAQAIPEGGQVNVMCSLLVSPDEPAITFSALIDYDATPAVMNAAIKAAAIAAAAAEGVTIGDPEAITITGAAAGL
jgi:hypothetical protein